MLRRSTGLLGVEEKYRVLGVEEKYRASGC